MSFITGADGTKYQLTEGQKKHGAFWREGLPSLSTDRLTTPILSVDPPPSTNKGEPDLPPVRIAAVNLRLKSFDDHNFFLVPVPEEERV